MNPLAEHLRFYQELGVTGISRDAKWRQRESASIEGVGVKAVAQDAASASETAGLKASTTKTAGRKAGTTGTAGLKASTTETAGLKASITEMAGFPSGADAASGIARASSTAAPMIFARSSVELLTTIREDIGECVRCKLHGQGRSQIVFGVGNPSADLMFVGEAPGADEDEQGIPFVGRAGQLLTKMIVAMGLERSDIYIANVLKCRPPGNRNPEPDEIAMCEPFLLRQIASIQPKVVIALGAFAAKTLLKTQDPISRLRGRVFDFRGAKLIPTFHPSFLLRSPGYKREAWEDLKKALVLLGREIPAPSPSAPAE